MTNKVQDGDVLQITPAANASSGDPVVVGANLCGVWVHDVTTAAAGSLAVEGVFDLSVKAVDADSNNAVAIGDTIFYASGETPKLNKNASAVAYGIALEAITQGATDTIRVLVGRRT
jgi:predicted RecA/RadA family phage recombinase